MDKQTEDMLEVVKKHVEITNIMLETKINFTSINNGSDKDMVVVVYTDCRSQSLIFRHNPKATYEQELARLLETVIACIRIIMPREDSMRFAT